MQNSFESEDTASNYQDTLVPHRPQASIENSVFSLHANKTNAQNITGLRQKRLIALIICLITLSALSILLLMLNTTLIKVLQMSTQGMRSLKIVSYMNEKTGKMESAVHFSTPNVDLGHIVVKSGKIVGSRNKKLSIQGSRVLLNTNVNDTRFLLQNGTCRFENTKQFQIISGLNGKVLFNANNPLVTMDRHIKQIAAKTMITSKIRAPINEDLKIFGENINFRGNEAIQIDARAFNATAKTSLILKTSKDGAIRLESRKIFIGNEWKPLAVSPSPSLIASIDAYRVCICISTRPKIFIVNGNKPCQAPSTICS